MSRTSPLVNAISGKIREAIISGRFPAGSTMPAERDLADEFGVSRTAIRSAIECLVQEKLLESMPRCRPVVTGPMAWRQSAERKDVGVWLWPNSTGFAASHLLSGIQSIFSHESNARLIIGSATGDDWDSMWDSEAKFLRSIAEDPNISGAILWYIDGVGHRNELERVRQAGVQLVFVDRYLDPNYPADYVGTDNTGSAEIAVNHLIELGHTRIAMIRNLDSASSVLERVDGWRAALSRAGITYDADLLERLDESGSDREQVAGPLKRLLALPSPPTAIFCVNDLVGLTAYDLLESWGIDIPGQLSLVGFDGLMSWLPGKGHLTTAVQDFRRIGEISARLVLDRVFGRAPRPHRHTMLAAPLLALDSSGPVPQTNARISAPLAGAI